MTKRSKKQSSETENHGQKNKSIILLVVLLPIMLLVGGLIAEGSTLIQQAANAVINAYRGLDRGDRSKLREEDVEPLTDNVSVLIVGIDERADDEWEATRADALLLATFNVTDKTVKLVSIPRDTLAYLPSVDKTTKINHAYAYDGIDGTVAAVEELFNIPVDYYIEFNYNSFIDIVDSLGGIKIDVPITFTEQDSLGIPDAISLEKGLQTLNGEEALALARTRKIDSDIYRGQRQQLVIEAIANRALSLDSFSKISDIIDIIDGNFTTDLSVNDMLAFYKYGSDIQISNLQVEGVDQYINGSYFYEPTEESIQSIHDTLYAHLHDLPIPEYNTDTSDDADDDSETNEDDTDTSDDDSETNEDDADTNKDES